MASNIAAERSAEVLRVLELPLGRNGPSGRYPGSTPIRPGVRYWAASKPRARQDMLGVQFFGEGCREGERQAPALQRRGFIRRNPQTGQITFAKPAPFAPDGSVDVARLRAIRRELDAVLSEESQDGAGTGLRQFFLASPLADLDLEPPARTGQWRPSEL